MTPLISVIIPCYNHAQYISCALDAMLAQTYDNLDIIIVDDYSTDNLADAVAPYMQKDARIRLVMNEYGTKEKQKAFGNTDKNTDSGWAARNYGVSLAKGEFITFQDADDGSHAERIEAQYTLSQQYSSHHVVVDWRQYRDELNGTQLGWIIGKEMVVPQEEVESLCTQTKRGLFIRPFSEKEATNPFLKLTRKIDRKFFHDWSSYPCAASMPFLKRDVFEKCRFRPLYERTRPAFNGRGADQDFNFWVAETFRDSIAVRVPLVLWRVNRENQYYGNIRV